MDDRMITDALSFPKLDDLQFTEEEIALFANSRVWLGIQKALREKLRILNTVIRDVRTTAEVRTYIAGRIVGIEHVIGLLGVFRANNLRIPPQTEDSEQNEEIATDMAVAEQRSEEALRNYLEDEAR